MNQSDHDSHRPISEVELLDYLDRLSNWGRWGDGVAGLRGTLNLITDESVARALAGARSGHVIACGLPVPFSDRIGTEGSASFVPGENEYPLRYLIDMPHLQKRMVEQPNVRAAVHDGFLMEPHGRLITHLDAPIHTILRGTLFNGVPVSDAMSLDGVSLGSIELASQGIVGRGVLLDVPLSKGLAWLDDGDRIYPEDLERCEKQQGVEVGAGDCLLVRTGYRARNLTGPPKGPGYQRPGLQAACLPWLRERDVAVISSDVPNDCFPHGYDLGFPIHTVGMWAMGMWLVDNSHLEALAVHCGEASRWDFLWVVAPLILSGVSCSPVNPLAIF